MVSMTPSLRLASSHGSFLSHDGFCLWDTKTTARKVTKSPLGPDVLRDLRRACDKHGIRHFGDRRHNLETARISGD